MIPITWLTLHGWIIRVTQILGISSSSSLAVVVQPVQVIGMTWMTSFIGLILVIGLLGFVSMFHLTQGRRTMDLAWRTDRSQEPEDLR
jgi:hypothetical protein